MSISFEYVRARFPIKNTTKIIGELTYKAINDLREALYENEAAIPTMLGGGGEWTRWTTHECGSVCEHGH